jgi:hypothetical protein
MLEYDNGRAGTTLAQQLRRPTAHATTRSMTPSRLSDDSCNCVHCGPTGTAGVTFQFCHLLTLPNVGKAIPKPPTRVDRLKTRAHEIHSYQGTWKQLNLSTFQRKTYRLNLATVSYQSRVFINNKKRSSLIRPFINVTHNIISLISGTTLDESLYRDSKFAFLPVSRH